MSTKLPWKILLKLSSLRFFNWFIISYRHRHRHPQQGSLQIKTTRYFASVDINWFSSRFCFFIPLFSVYCEPPHKSKFPNFPYDWLKLFKNQLSLKISLSIDLFRRANKMFFCISFWITRQTEQKRRDCT